MAFDLLNRIRRKSKPVYFAKPYEMPEEFCTNCNADLSKQKGYSPELAYWSCRSCGVMLTNPELEYFDDSSDIVWFCDSCEALLNGQEGFCEEVSEWRCTCCGHVNPIAEGLIYENEEEYAADRTNPTRGLCEAELLALTCYQEVRVLDEERKVSIVKDPMHETLFVKKILNKYDTDVLRQLKDHPIAGMPQIIEVFEADRHRIVIEEYIEGDTLEAVLEQGPFSVSQTRQIVLQLCDIVQSLHELEPAVIHRDIKPANIILNKDQKVYLLDVDAAKHFTADEREDTVLLGTKEYAAPEQYGFGASSVRTDIYAIGVLMNVLLTGRFPKECQAEGELKEIIAKCIKLDPQERFGSVRELKDKLLGCVN